MSLVMVLRNLLRLLVDIVVIAAAFLLAFEFRFEFATPPEYRSTAFATLPVVVLAKMVSMHAFGLHRRSWRFVALSDVLVLTTSMVVPTVVLAVARRWLAAWPLWPDALAPIPFGVLGVDLALSMIGLFGVRALRRIQVEQTTIRSLRSTLDGGALSKRVLIAGAGQAGSAVAREILARPDLGIVPVGYLDDSPGGRGHLIHGIKVLGALSELDRVVEQHDVNQVIIAIPGASGRLIRDVTNSCTALNVEVRIVPAVHEILHGRVQLSRIRPVSIADLLHRAPASLDSEAIASIVAGRTVMVTGAGGSIGSELSRQLIGHGASRIVLIDQAENALWEIHQELEALRSNASLQPVVADVTDRAGIDIVVRRELPSLVFHAAAHKHVPMMEANPGEAVRNNLFGTCNVVDAVVRHGVERFVLVSTDKAARPSSVMGATKRLAERYVQAIARETGRTLVTVRFGNVLGSAGSVVPVFERQIAAGGPVTVTHPEMTRYLMTIPEAVALVIQAAAVGEPAETLALDMGDPVKIVDLARDLITLSGHEPGVDIDIVFSGVRPGENLHEQIASPAERLVAGPHPSLFVVESEPNDTWSDRKDVLAALHAASQAGEPRDVVAALSIAVPDFNR